MYLKYFVLATPPTVKFYADSFETLQVFKSRSEDVHIVRIESSDYFCHFLQVQLSHFTKLIQVLCVGNSYSFSCLDHSLKMCIYLNIILRLFCHFSKVEFSLFPGIITFKVNR